MPAREVAGVAVLVKVDVILAQIMELSDTLKPAHPGPFARPMAAQAGRIMNTQPNMGKSRANADRHTTGYVHF